jgi:uncharacterized protein YciI
MISPEVMAIAEAQAAKDRDLLARLVAEGKIMRSGPHSALTRDIARRLDPHAGINLAIRPNKKRKKARR